MSLDEVTLAMSGAILLGYLVIGAFFWRFWVITRERLFVFFSIAFCLLGLERLLLMIGEVDSPNRPLLYITRLIAFLVIIAGIWNANRRKI